MPKGGDKESTSVTSHCALGMLRGLGHLGTCVLLVQGQPSLPIGSWRD